MCGIAGILAWGQGTVEERDLRALSEALSARGPDDQGIMMNSRIGLVHRRLSIIDLSEAGRCPMPNEDGSISIVFNGEIFNYRELREQLEAAGHRFRSRSDTEVVLHGYEEWGEDALARLNGMFAFALWDEQRQRLFLARDRLGEKPLYYLRLRDRFIFASTLSALSAAASRHLQVEPAAIRTYLCYGFIPGPDTIWSGVSSLMPSHCLSVDERGETSVSQYWDFPHGQETRMSAEEAPDVVEQMLEESVRSRLVADVPVGGFLSGGVDSSLVMALAARNASGLRTFSVGFREQDYSELPYARLVAEHIGSRHREVVLGEDDMISAIPQLVWHYGQPYGDSSCLATFLISRVAAEEMKVCLSGDGGDEAFAGHRRALVGWYASLYRASVPGMVRERLIPALGRAGPLGRFQRLNALSVMGPAAAQVNALSWLEEIDRIAGDGLSGALPEAGAEDFWPIRDGSFLRQVLYHDYRVQLPDDFLVKVDIASMAASLEVRPPFLDHRFVEFAWKLPDTMKLRYGKRKWLLKEIAARHVPREAVYREKMGFALPMQHLWKGKLADILSLLMKTSAAVRHGWIRPEPVLEALDGHRRGKRRHETRLWLVLWLELWARIMLDRTLDRDADLSGLLAR